MLGVRGILRQRQCMTAMDHGEGWRHRRQQRKGETEQGTPGPGKAKCFFVSGVHKMRGDMVGGLSPPVRPGSFRTLPNPQASIPGTSGPTPGCECTRRGGQAMSTECQGLLRGGFRDTRSFCCPSWWRVEKAAKSLPHGALGGHLQGPL